MNHYSNAIPVSQGQDESLYVTGGAQEPSVEAPSLNTWYYGPSAIHCAAVRMSGLPDRIAMTVLELPVPLCSPLVLHGRLDGLRRSFPTQAIEAVSHRDVAPNYSGVVLSLQSGTSTITQ